MDQFLRVLPSIPVHDVQFVCIGTDRSTGDSLGPLVGTRLTQLGFPNVIGTIDEPCHAENLDELAGNLPDNRVVVAIDACLGLISSVGRVKVEEGSIHPGAGVGKELTPVGDYSISGIVNIGGFMEYFVLQNTRLSIVLKMVDEIVEGICSVYTPVSAMVAAGKEQEGSYGSRNSEALSRPSC